MIPIGEPLPPGYCQHCREECRDRLGIDIYPDRPELAKTVIWECVFCGARVGTHEDGPHKGKPLGTAADPELRKARVMLHALVDPVWLKASELPEYLSARTHRDRQERMKALAIIKRTARVRVYAFMAAHMGLEKDACHIAMFDLEQCRAAWRVFRGIGYADVRDWAHFQKAKEKARGAQGSDPEPNA